jgi:hypothetical protein
MVISRLWVLLALPTVCYLVARVAVLEPWPTAPVTALLGELFLVAISYGVEGNLGIRKSWLEMGLRLLFLGVGIFLTRLAILRGRAAAARVEAKAAAETQSSADEYAAFAAEAERIAQMHERSKGESTPVQNEKKDDA